MGITATAAYIQPPDCISYREVPLSSPGPGQLLLDVLACGICGSDLNLGASRAQEPKPFGHEVVGAVREVGPGVTHVRPGDRVALESGSFCGVCDRCRNGRADLCRNGANLWGVPAMGFSTAMPAPAQAAIPIGATAVQSAVLAEPCGVALDMVKVAEIGATDRVLVVGTGAIGLMALAIARRLTCGPVVAANRTRGRLATAERLGADATVVLGETPLPTCGEAYGGFDRVLVTAPPQLIPESIAAAAYGGIIVFIGFPAQDTGVIPLDTNALHTGKKQLRASYASPAVYLPEALQLLRTGVVPPAEIISHRFPLSQLADAFRLLRSEPDSTRKVVIIPDEHFAG